MRLFGHHPGQEEEDEAFEKERTRLASIVQHAIESVARDEIENGRAEVRSARSHGDPMIVLTPQDSGAAPLRAQIDSGRQVTFYPGRNDMIFEAFSKDSGEIEQETRSIATTVIEGTYVERIRRKSPDRIQAIAEWTAGGKRHKARLNVLRRPKADSPGWQTVRYEPY